MIFYNCRGYSSIKASYNKLLLFQCDVLFVEERWLLSSKLHLLQNISNELIVISKSGMNDHELLTGRPYGGTTIFLRKTLNCAITNFEIDCDRLCATLVDFKNFTVLFSCFYMSCDSGGNCDSFNAIVCAFQSLRARYEPGYVICIGDFTVDLSRVQSSQTVMFKNFCCSEGLTHYTIGNPVEYTYSSDINSWPFCYFN